MSDQEVNEQELPMPSSTDEMTSSPGLSAGALLAARREALGLTVERAAEQLKMSPRQILAIETDNYAAVHGKSIFKGFVRAYAKVLRIDPEPLVALVPEERVDAKSLVPVIHDATQNFNESRLPFVGRRDSSSRWVLLSILVLVVLIVVLGAQKLGWLPEFSQMAKWYPARQAASASVTASVQKPASAKEETGSKDKIKRIELPAVDVSSQLASVPPAAPVAPAAATPETAPAAPATPETAAPATEGKNDLVLKCRDKSWVEVRRANGSVLFEKTIPAGGSETIAIAEPVQLTLGNGAAVDALFRGKALDVRPESGSKVARLSLK